MLSILATLSCSQKYFIYAVDKKGLEIPFAKFNLDETIRVIAPERITTDIYQPGSFEFFDLKLDDGSVIRTKAPYHTNAISMKLTVTKKHIPLALEIKSSSGRKKSEITISLNAPKLFAAPHIPQPKQQEQGGGFSPFLMIPLVFILMRMCMGGGGAAPAAAH